jgi:hypothetical protein
MAFWNELEKIGAALRSSTSSWSSKTVGAPRSKVPPKQMDRAPTLSDSPSPKLVGPASQYGKRQNYSQPNVAAPPPSNPTQGMAERMMPPPNVVFGVR